MIGTGPLHGKPIETGLVIASTDPVAADAVGAKLFGFNADAVHHIWEAGRMGLGETEVDNMEFPALSLKDAIGIFTEAAYCERLQFQE
jgi:uncharacterized protein (DUF362 family)